jgi:D-alanine-D-alanine ligase
MSSVLLIVFCRSSLSKELLLMKIAFVYDSFSRDHGSCQTESGCPDVSGHVPASLNTIEAAFGSEHEVTLIPHDDRLEDHLLTSWPDLVLRLTDDFGQTDDDITLSSMLERWHIPYAGSPPRTLQLCQDLEATRRALRKRGLPTPVFTVAQVLSDLREIDRFPVSVKPLFDRVLDMESEGCLAYTPSDMREQVRSVVEIYDQPALVETFMPGRAFTVAILGNGSQATVLPLVERRYVVTPADIRSTSGVQPAYDCPARVGVDLGQQLKDLGQQAFLALGCLDFCSVHIRLDENEQPYIMEISPLPGLLPQTGRSSAFLQAASAAGMTYPVLISRIFRLASYRQGLKA